MTEKTTHTNAKQENRPFYLITPLFSKANQIGVQNLKERKDREISLNQREAGTQKVCKAQDEQKGLLRKVFIDRKGLNQPHSFLYKGGFPLNNEVPKATLLPERFVNLLMSSGRKDKARKCLTLALLSITSRIGVPDPLKSLANLPSKQSQIDLKPSAKQAITNENQGNDKQGSAKPLQIPYLTQRERVAKQLSPKNQVFTKDRRNPVRTKSKTDKPLNVLGGSLSAGFAKGSNHSLISACLANLKWGRKKLNPALGFWSVSQVFQPLRSTYKANPASRIKAIEKIERGCKGQVAHPCPLQPLQPPRNSPIYPTLNSRQGRKLIEPKHEFCKEGDELGVNKEGGEKPTLQPHSFLAWRGLLTPANDSGPVRVLPSAEQSCLADHLGTPELGDPKRMYCALQNLPTNSQSNCYLYLGGLPTDKQLVPKELYNRLSTNQPTPVVLQALPTLPFATLSLPFHGKRFETRFPFLLSQNHFSLSLVRRSLREEFVLTRSGIERRQETRESRDYLMGLLWQSFLLGLGRPQQRKGFAKHSTNSLHHDRSANLTVLGFAKSAFSFLPCGATLWGETNPLNPEERKLRVSPRKGFSFNTNKTWVASLLPTPRLSALFRWEENRFLPLIGVDIGVSCQLRKETHIKAGSQTWSPGRNHCVNVGFAQLLFCLGKSVAKGCKGRTNRFPHFLVYNTPLKRDVEAVRKLLPFAQSTKGERFSFLPRQSIGRVASHERKGFTSHGTNAKWFVPTQTTFIPPVRSHPSKSYQGFAKVSLRSVPAQNLSNLEETLFLAKPRTVGKRWVGLESNFFSTPFPRKGLPSTLGKPQENTSPALPNPWGLKPNVGFNPQDEKVAKGKGLKDHYIWHTQVLLKGVQRVQPALEVRRVRKGRNTFQVPAVVKQKRGEKLAIKWIVDSARKSRQKGNKGFSESLGNQLLQSFDRLGEARSKRNELLRLAESNRPFLRFRWW